MSAWLVLVAFWHFSADRAPRKPGPAGAAVRAVAVQRHNIPVVEHTIGTVISPTTVQPVQPGCLHLPCVYRGSPTVGYITPVIYVYLDRFARRFDLRSGEAAAAASPG